MVAMVTKCSQLFSLIWYSSWKRASLFDNVSEAYDTATVVSIIIILYAQETINSTNNVKENGYFNPLYVTSVATYMFQDSSSDSLSYIIICMPTYKTIIVVPFFPNILY